MIVLPTSNAAKRVSRTRIAPMIEETPSLRDKVREAKSRDSGNTVLMKEFDGGVLLLAGANSATELKSSPIRNLFLDEIEEYPADVDGQGDPEELAEKRTDTFARKKIFKCSTPTIVGGRIDRAYKASDQRLCFVPCPRCGHEQHLRFEQLRWETRKVTSSSTAATGEIREVRAGHAGALERDTHELLDVWYECEAAGCRIDEHEKPEFLARAAGSRRTRARPRQGLQDQRALLAARLVPLAPGGAEAPRGRARHDRHEEEDLRQHGPRRGLRGGRRGDRAALAEGPRRAELAPGADPGACLRSSPASTCSTTACSAACGASAATSSRWVIDRIVIFGSPALERPGKASRTCSARATRTRRHQHAHRAMAIDAGDGVTTHFVRVLRAQVGAHAARDRGEGPGGGGQGDHRQADEAGRELPRPGAEGRRASSGRTAPTRRRARCTRASRSRSRARLRAPADGLPDEFFEQLTSERRVTRYLRGQPRTDWLLEKGRRNEDLDCAGMAHCAAEYWGLRTAPWDKLEQLRNPRQQDLADLLPDLATLRQRSRDLVRNTPIAGGALNTAALNVVGTGLMLKPNPDREALGWSEEQAAPGARASSANGAVVRDAACDVTRTQTFYGLQDLAFRSAFENGDALALLPYARCAAAPTSSRCS
jgi:hypothetical protein